MYWVLGSKIYTHSIVIFKGFYQENFTKNQKHWKSITWLNFIIFEKHFEIIYSLMNNCCIVTVFSKTRLRGTDLFQSYKWSYGLKTFLIKPKCMIPSLRIWFMDYRLIRQKQRIRQKNWKVSIYWSGYNHRLHLIGIQYK